MTLIPELRADLRAAAQRPDRRSWLSRPRPVVGLGIGAGAVAALTVLAIALVPSGHGHIASVLRSTGVTPGTADAAVIKSRALQALDSRSGAIFKVDEITKTTDNGKPAGTTSYQSWTSTGTPRYGRILQEDSGAPSAESAITSAGYQQLYNPRGNTIYQYVPHLNLTPGPTPGTQTLTVPNHTLVSFGDTRFGSKLPAGDTAAIKLVVPDSEIPALKSGVDQVSYRFVSIGPNRRGVIGSRPFIAKGKQGGFLLSSSSWRGPISQMLSDPTSKVDKTATYHGQPAIKISGVFRVTPHTTGQPTTLWVAPDTYKPLQEIYTYLDRVRGKPAHRMVSTITFVAFGSLTGAAASPHLLSLTAQHPTATIDTNLHDWYAAQPRLYPNG